MYKFQKPGFGTEPYDIHHLLERVLKNKTRHPLLQAACQNLEVESQFSF